MKKNEYLEIIESKINGKLFDEAELCIEQYKHAYGYDDKIASTEAIINIYNNKLEKAIECIQEGFKYNLFNGDLYVTLGNIYELKEDYNRAYLCYEHSLEVEMNEENYLLSVNLMNNLKNDNKITLNKYSIIILTYNNLDYTKVCIDSIKKYNKLNNYEIIIVDNNSTDGTVEWIKEQKNIKYILNSENKGFPAGCNQGVELSKKGNDIFLLNNDTVIMPNSIFNLRMGLYSDENIGATGSVSNSISYYQQIDAKYDNFDDYIKFSLKNNITNSNSYKQRIKLVGFAMFIKRIALDKVGLLDERFTPGNFEDDDLSLRIINEGYRLLLCKDSYIHHFGSVSFKEKPQQYNELLEVNANKFNEKWEFSSSNSTMIKYELVNLITEPEDKELNILEIGCKCGATLLEVKNRYKKSNLYGIESNKYAANIAKNIANIQIFDLDNIDYSIYKEGFFDYIILSDTFKYVYDQKNFLKNIAKYIHADGYILADIPNTMHFSTIRNLLQGNCTCQNSGLLDKNNLKFFTKNEIIKIFKEVGFRNLYMAAIETITTNSDIEFIEKLSNLSANNVKEQFRIYKYIIKARKSEILDEEIVKKCSILLRRIEFNIDVKETEEELIKNLKNKLFTKEVIIESVAKHIIDKVYILNYVALKLIGNDMFDDILIFLDNAYSLEPQNLDTNYNIAYVLNMFGEKSLALEYLNKLETNDLKIEELKSAIEGGE